MKPKFKRGDIVLSLPPFSRVVFVILEVDPSKPKNIYSAKNVATGKGYWLSNDALQKVGVADAAYMDGLTGIAGTSVAPIGPGEVEQGQKWALAMSHFGTEDEKRRWKVLAGLETGDPLQIRARSGFQMVTFVGVLLKGKKYVFLAVANGKSYRYPLDAIALEPAVKA